MIKPGIRLKQHILEAENAIAAVSESGSLTKGMQLVRDGLEKTKPLR